MNPNRALIVWAAGTAVVLGAFLVFVLGGWPGAADGCLASTPNGCFCEAFDPADVAAGAAGVRQPVNTWFNLYALITSRVVALAVSSDRRKLAGPPPNLMKSATLVPDLLVFAILFLGLGSMWFHASLTAWGGIVDRLSMYLYAAFLPFYSIRRMWNSASFFWIGWLATVILLTALGSVIPSVVAILLLVVAYVIVEVVIWVRTGAVMQGRAKTRTLWLLAIASIGVATLFWALSQTGRPLCHPTSLFQPHGMIWHPLAGVMALLLYFYWREAVDPVDPVDRGSEPAGAVDPVDPGSEPAGAVDPVDPGSEPAGAVDPV